jgi:hypothetical protein
VGGRMGLHHTCVYVFVCGGGLETEEGAGSHLGVGDSLFPSSKTPL